MLSYHTIVAIQLLHVLQKHKQRPMNVTELKQKCLLRDFGNAAGRILRTLYRQGWVDSNCRSKYWLVVDLLQKNLLELCLIIDNNRIQLCNHVGINCWGEAAQKEMLHAIDLNEQLRQRFTLQLASVNLGRLVASDNLPGGAAEIRMTTKNKMSIEDGVAV
jgi:hypothetical protein